MGCKHGCVSFFFCRQPERPAGADGNPAEADGDLRVLVNEPSPLHLAKWQTRDDTKDKWAGSFFFSGSTNMIAPCPPAMPPPPSPPLPPPRPSLPPQPQQQRLATNVQCLPIRSDEALLDFSGAKPQRFLHCAHPPPAERARIVPVPQGRTCCTTTWAALPVTTVRRQVKNARQRCRSSATSAPIQDAPVRP